MKAEKLHQAAEDLRYLLNRGYPRASALQWVGNRYGLTFDERHLLHRGVFSDRDARERRKKLIPAGGVRNRILAVDGHNVLITIEAGLSGRPLILADDGLVRDMSGLSGNFKRSVTTEEALRLVFQTLKRLKPRLTQFFFDAPISKSGELAHEVREGLSRENLRGDAQALPVPEKRLVRFPGVVATSDTALIDQSKRVVDLAGYILRPRFRIRSLLRKRRKRGPPPPGAGEK